LTSQMESVDCGLRPGVTLYLGGAQDCLDRVQLSSGTTLAAAVAPGDVYEEDARIPRPGWRSLTTADRKALITESCPTSCGNAISVMRIPAELLDPFRTLQSAAAKHRSKEQLLPIIGGEDCASGTAAIISYLTNFLQPTDVGEPCAPQGGISARPPRLQTLSMDPGTHALLGLHIDSWYWRDLAVNDRRHAPNRVCINIGATDRFFLFLNIPIAQMYDLVKHDKSKPAGGYGPSAIARDFMRMFPSYPAIRLRIRPGEAYIAPTENIAHDGSTIGMDAMDITLTVLGRFGLCAN
jgi:hypothetical protein